MPTRTAPRSPDELAFLRTITADLSNPLPQLVYADWLEERGDPRGPFLRDFVEACQQNQPLPDDLPEVTDAWAEALALPLRRRLRQPVKATKANPATVNRLLAHEPVILRAMRPCVQMKMNLGRTVRHEGLEPGWSRAGGLPDLQPEVPWPTYPERGREWPMQFLFQVNLADLQGTFAEEFLPNAGLLSVFHYPLHDEPRPRVLYTPPGVALWLTDVPEPGHWEPRWAGTEHLRTEVTFPIRFADRCPVPSGIPWEHSLGHEASARLYEDYFDFTLHLPAAMEGPRHALCQTWYPECCSTWATLYDTLPPGLFRLALLDSHEAPADWGFGDGNSLHVFVDLDDARVGKFDRVITTEYAP